MHNHQLSCCTVSEPRASCQRHSLTHSQPVEKWMDCTQDWYAIAAADGWRMVDGERLRGRRTAVCYYSCSRCCFSWARESDLICERGLSVPGMLCSAAHAGTTTTSHDTQTCFLHRARRLERPAPSCLGFIAELLA